MINVDGIIFHEYNLAFHFVRENVWSPWEVIGVYLTGPTHARCRYLPEYKRIQDAFTEEVELAGRISIASSKEFLDKWRRDHQDHDSVIGPVINYCTTRPDFVILLSHLYNRYVGINSAKVFARIAIMLKERDRYFALKATHRSASDPAKMTLKKAGLA